MSSRLGLLFAVEISWCEWQYDEICVTPLSVFTETDDHTKDLYIAV